MRRPRARARCGARFSAHLQPLPSCSKRSPNARMSTAGCLTAASLTARQVYKKIGPEDPRRVGEAKLVQVDILA